MAMRNQDGTLNQWVVLELPWDWMFICWDGEYPIVRNELHTYFRMSETEVRRLDLPDLSFHNLAAFEEGSINHPWSLIKNGVMTTQLWGPVQSQFMDQTNTISFYFWYQLKLIMDRVQPSAVFEGVNQDPNGPEQPDRGGLTRELSPPPFEYQVIPENKKTHIGRFKERDRGKNPPKRRENPESVREKEERPDETFTQGDFWKLLAGKSDIPFEYDRPDDHRSIQTFVRDVEVPLGALVARSMELFKDQNPGVTFQDGNAGGVDFPVDRQDGRLFKELKSVATDDHVDLRHAGDIEWTLYELLAYAPWHLKSPDFYERVGWTISMYKGRLAGGKIETDGRNSHSTSMIVSTHSAPYLTSASLMITRTTSVDRDAGSNLYPEFFIFSA